MSSNVIDAVLRLEKYVQLLTLMSIKCLLVHHYCGNARDKISRPTLLKYIVKCRPNTELTKHFYISQTSAKHDSKLRQLYSPSLTSTRQQRHLGSSLLSKVLQQFYHVLTLSSNICHYD